MPRSLFSTRCLRMADIAHNAAFLMASARSPHRKSGYYGMGLRMRGKDGINLYGISDGILSP